VKALTIVKHFDVLEQCQACRGMRGQWLIEFGLERAEEAFHHGVVVTVALASHAGDDPLIVQQLLERAAGVLHASVAVMDQSVGGIRPPRLQRMLQCLFDQFASHVIGRGPADDAATEAVEHRRQIEPALTRLDVGDVRQPLLIRRRGGEIALDHVGRDRMMVPAVGGARMAFTRAFPL